MQVKEELEDFWVYVDLCVYGIPKSKLTGLSTHSHLHFIQLIPFSTEVSAQQLSPSETRPSIHYLRRVTGPPETNKIRAVVLVFARRFLFDACSDVQ